MTRLSNVVDAIENAVESDKNIAVYGDYDADGLFALMIFKDTFREIEYPNVFLYEYSNRTHEIDFNFLNFCLARQINFAIICDTGSNDMEILEKFCAYGIECVVLDHHRTTATYADFPQGMSVQNVQIDLEQYGVNNQMRGAGLAFVTAATFMEKIGHQFDIGYFATYALIAQYADAIPMDTEFGRYLYEAAQGAKTIPPTINYFLDDNFAVTRRFAEYVLAPKINAVFRREQFSLVNGLFLLDSPDVFMLVNQIKELHFSTIKTVEKILDEIQFEDLNGILVANLSPFLTAGYPRNFIVNHKGRIATSLATAYGKPCVCVCDNGKWIEGSFRDIVEAK
ncbi:hypothetical protein AGMMS49975_20170 [Clostridia bacterium]|nr:hypothetical protein AGMMS49975_20170 [Clostridia bacterium]